MTCLGLRNYRWRLDTVMNSLFLNSDSLGCLDKVYSDSKGRSTKVRDDYKGEQEEETGRGRQDDRYCMRGTSGQSKEDCPIY